MGRSSQDSGRVTIGIKSGGGGLTVAAGSEPGGEDRSDCDRADETGRGTGGGSNSNNCIHWACAAHPSVGIGITPRGRQENLSSGSGRSDSLGMGGGRRHGARVGGDNCQAMGGDGRAAGSEVAGRTTAAGDCRILASGVAVACATIGVGPFRIRQQTSSSGIASGSSGAGGGHCNGV